MYKDQPGSRRDFLRISLALSSVVLPVTVAAELKKVDARSASARALQYAVNSNKPGRNCSNCTLFRETSSREFGQCPLFQQQLVKRSGWCSAWTPRA